MAKSQSFRFDGGAADYLGTAIGATVITLVTCGLGFPFAICMFQNWKTKHTLVNGRRLKFMGNGFSLMGQWLKWWFLTLITCGIYSFWIAPSLQKWIAGNTEFEDMYFSTKAPAAPARAPAITRKPPKTPKPATVPSPEPPAPPESEPAAAPEPEPEPAAAPEPEPEPPEPEPDPTTAPEPEAGTESAAGLSPAIYCPHCGTRNASDHRYCVECGAGLP